MEILISSLLANDEEPADEEVKCDRCSAHPPGENISDEIDMSMVFNPEVLK